MKKLAALAPIIVVVLSACGGGDSTLDRLLAEASAKQSEARMLVADAPCDENAQCSVLYFGSTKPGCPTQPTASDYKVYSLLSATAKQAKEASDQYNLIAGQARQIQAGGESYACTTQAYLLPVPVCSANKCQVPPG